ncbi:MAG: rhodanese-like domain-containing protein [Desulfobulbaceae bacterium]|nr:rhodanese-like domain-containing protein [Desulfobulbaceae bacterium]
MRKPSQFSVLLVTLLCGMLFMGAGLAGANDKFPLRAKHPNLSPIETAELVSNFSDAIIVDARNKVEFDVVQMVGAHNILVGQMKEADLLALRPKDGAAPMVFYCNGTTCSKSYKAAEKATEWGFKNVRVYDEGIFHWAKNQPERTKFFGQKLTAETVKTALISKDELAKACVPTAEFLAMAASDKYTVFDIRDPNERKEQPIRIPKLKVMPMDTFVNLLEKKSKAIPTSSILILDNVGKQVDWIQYYLIKEGVTDYRFLKGGVRQWVKDGYSPEGTK